MALKKLSILLIVIDFIITIKYNIIVGYILIRRFVMNINKELDGSTLTLKVEGRIDTTTAPELENTVKGSVDGITSLIFDFSSLDYISSAGLRVLLSAQKIMNEKGDMIVENVSDDINEIFEVTGFSDILTIK